MFKNSNWRQYLPYSIVAAILHGIAVFVFLRDSSFTHAYILYIGSFLFMFTIAAFLITFNRRRQENANSMSMLTAGLITSAMGVILSCVLCAILLAVMIPGLFHAGTPAKVLTDAPANTVTDKTHGLLFMIFGSATMGNIVGGLFVCIIFPFALKGDQTKESTLTAKDPTPTTQQPRP
jgi:hypothetical protein